jgi:hypothetical protein
MKATVAIALLTLSMFTPGCIGNFAMTHDVWTNNMKIENGFGREMMFLGLIIIPVYEVALLADLLIFNTAELFTGESIYGSPTKTPESDTDLEP